jgi:hypothetical protein
MAPPDANIETVVLARNLPNDCIDFSIPGGSARNETAMAILLSKHQRGQKSRSSRPGDYTKLKTDKLAADVRNTASSEAAAFSHFQTQWGSPGGGGEVSIGSNIVTSLAPGETL